MPSVNEDLADLFRILALSFERFSADIRRRVLALLLAMEDDLIAQIQRINPTEPLRKTYRDARLAKLLEQTRASIVNGYKAVNKEVNADLIEVADISSAATVLAVNEVVGAEIMTVALAPEMFRALVDDTMILGAPSKEWWGKQAGDTVFRFKSAVQQGYAQGETVEQIVRRVKGTRERNYKDGALQTTRRNAASLVHSSVQAISNSARFEVFKNNEDILTGYQQISTLDQKTTDICRAFSGKRWLMDGTPDGHHLPFNGGPPRHWNSLVAGSVITTTRGPVPIEDIQIADRVLTHRGRFQPVYATMSKRCETGIVRVIRTESGREIRATDEHPVLTFIDGWKRADQIQVGDQLFEDADNSVRVEPLLVIVGATDNYPAPLHESQVFDSILVAPAVVSASIHFQDDFVIREPEVAHLLGDDELVNEVGSRDAEQFQHGIFALGDGCPVPVGNHVAYDFLHVGQSTGVVGLHANAVSSMDCTVFLGHAPCPVAFSALPVGGIAGMQAGSFNPGSSGDFVSPTPCLQNGFPNIQIPFDLSERLSLSEVFSLDKGSDDAAIFEVDRPSSSGTSHRGFLLAHDLDSVTTASRQQHAVAQAQSSVESANGILSFPMLGLDESGEGDGVGEIDRTHWILSRVVSVECVPYTKTVHNIAVANDETYVANGIAVHNCRSVLVAWMKDIDDLPDGKRRKVPEATQASMDGQVAADLDYESWLRQKGDDFARSVMGEGKFALWKAGKITQTDLLDQSGNPLTLAELRAKFGI